VHIREVGSFLIVTRKTAKKELMRHATADMTLATYAQAVGDEKRNAGERVASLVMPNSKAA
jgi:hypothetical protein